MTNETSVPVVTVIIPAFNAAAYVCNAVESVLAQSYSPIEIIVIDDHSSDETCKVLAHYEIEGKIRLIRQAKNQGVAVARNAGIRQSKSKYIAFLDADDLWLPHHVERALDILEAHPNIDVVMQNFEIADLQTKKRLGIWFDERREALAMLECEQISPQCKVIVGGFLSAMMVGCFVHLQAVFARKSIFDTVMFDERLRCSEDVDWAMRSVHQAKAKWSWMEQCSGIYFRHPGSLTAMSMKKHTIIEETGLMLFSEYLRWKELDKKSRDAIQLAVVNCSLELSYFSRTNKHAAKAWSYWGRSLRYGLSLRQLQEATKLFLMTPNMILGQMFNK